MMKTDLFMKVLPYLLEGMGGIFIVTLVIICCIAILNRFTSPQKKKDK